MTGRQHSSLMLNHNDDASSIMVPIPALFLLDGKGEKRPLPSSWRNLTLPIQRKQQQPTEEKQISSLFSQAVASHESGDWIQALQGFSKVLDLFPSHADAAFNIAAILQMLGNPRLAVYYITLVRCIA